MATPIPLQNPLTAGTSSTDASWFSGLGDWLDGTFNTVVDAGKSVLGNYFDFQSTLSQQQAANQLLQQQQAQAAYLAAIKSGQITQTPYAQVPLGGAAQGQVSGLPAWAVPVGLVVVAGFVVVMMVKK